MRISGRLLVGLLAVAAFFFSCKKFPFDHPLDPDSDEYVGILSEDNDGDGVGQWEDVDEIQLISPADQAMLDTASAVLCVFPFNPQKVTNYWIQVSTSASSFSESIVWDKNDYSSNECEILEGNLVGETPYYWRAMAFDGSKWSDTWSEIRSFIIDFDTNALWNPSPADVSTINETTPLLDWADVPTAVGYHIQINTNDSFTGAIVEDNNTVMASEYQVIKTLSDGTTYYWHVRLQNDDGLWGDWGDKWSFEVDTTPPVVITSPVLDGGNSYTRDEDVTVSHSVSEATEMIMSEDSSFTDSSWMTYLEDPVYTLSTGDGTKTVYIKYRDNVGNETATYSDTIVYDHNVYVSSSGSDSNSGEVASPLSTLNAAVTLAQSSTPVEVRVEGGPTELVYDLGSSGLSIPAGVSLMGGYDSTFSNRDSDTYISKITSTDSYTIIFDGQSITNTTQIDGFTITNTSAFLANVYTIYCTNSAAPTITHSIINNEGTSIESLTNRTAATAGIYCDNSNPVIEYNTINGGSGTATREQSAGSAGIYCQNASPTIRYNIAINGGSGTINSSSSSNSVGSAGIRCYYSSPDISYNTEINGGTGAAGVENQCSGSAGIHCEGSSPVISNNTMIHGGSGNYNSGFAGQGAGSTGIFGINMAGNITGNIEINGGGGTTNGTSSAGSAGIYFWGEDTMIGGTTISNNTTIYGGNGSATGGMSAGSAGIYYLYASPTIDANTEINGGSGSANNNMLSVGAGSVGIYCSHTDWDGQGSVISNNTIINGGNGTTNTIESAGSAAIYCCMSNPNIFNNATLNGGSGIANNAESSGSVGIYCYGDTGTPDFQSPIIGSNNQINGGTGTANHNQSAGSAGIYCNASSPIIKNNLVQGEDGNANTNAFVDSVAIFFIDSSSSPKIVNNILKAEATNHDIASSIFIGGAGGRIANNIIFTTGGTSRYGMYEDGTGNDPTTVQNNLVFNCPTALYYDEGTTPLSTIAEVNSVAECSNNITTTQSLAQLFVGGSPFDYHLTSGSYAIDTGLDARGTYWGEVTDDIDGETRPKGSEYDIGFDEY